MDPPWVVFGFAKGELKSELDCGPAAPTEANGCDFGLLGSETVLLEAANGVEAADDNIGAEACTLLLMF